jgi:hypothetical protein
MRGMGVSERGKRHGGSSPLLREVVPAPPSKKAPQGPWMLESGIAEQSSESGCSALNHCSLSWCAYQQASGVVAGTGPIGRLEGPDLSLDGQRVCHAHDGGGDGDRARG